MTVYRHQKKWRYDFWKHGVRHRKGGYATKEKARIAEADAKRNLAKMNLDFLKLCESRLRDVKKRRGKDYFLENERLLKQLIIVWGKVKF